MFEKISNIGFGILVSVLVARIFGPEQYGYFSMYFSLSLMLSFFVGLGADGLIIKKLIDSSSPDSVMGAFFQLKVVGFLFYVILYLVSIFILFDSPDITQISIIIVSVLFKIWLFFRLYFESIKAFSVAASGVMLSRILAVSFLLLATELSLGNDALLIYLVVDSSISGLFYYFTYLKKSKLKFVPIKQIFPLCSEVAPYALTAAIFPIFMQLDVVMLGDMVGPVETGLYSVAIQMVTPFSFLGYVFISALYPSIVQAVKKESVLIMLKFASQSVIIISYIYIGFVFLLGESIILLLFGHEYLGSKGILNTLSILSLFAFTASIYSRMLVIENKAKFGVTKSLLATIVNVILNLILIPKHGANGAAIASIAAFALADLFSYLLNKDLRYIGVIGLKSLFFLNVDCYRSITKVFR